VVGRQILPRIRRGQNPQRGNCGGRTQVDSSADLKARQEAAVVARRVTQDLVVTIKDNGRGFDPEAKGRGALGL